MKPAPSEAQGTCIVLGVESQIGLAIVRELGRAGVRVIAVSHDAKAIGLASRFVAESRIVATPRSPAMLAALLELGRRHGPCSLVTVSEANMAWLATQRRTLEPTLRLALPPDDAFAAALDKGRTLQVAAAQGIDVPRTEEPASLDDLQRIAASFPFPAVLKWKDPGAVAAALGAAGLELMKAEYVYSAEELLAIGRRYAPIGQWPLVQQYCAGRGLGQFFFLRDGQVVQRFQHLRIAEWPPEGGFSSVCDAVPLDQHRALQQRSIDLLRAIGWEGVAMVEYRLDLATGRAVLMEINGRFWGSFPLAAHAGAGFALLAHRSAMGWPTPGVPPARDDLRCRMAATELKRLHRLWLQPSAIKDRLFRVRRLAELGRFVGDFLRPRVRYYVWSADDPAPFWADLRNLLRKGT